MGAQVVKDNCNSVVCGPFAKCKSSLPAQCVCETVSERPNYATEGQGTTKNLAKMVPVDAQSDVEVDDSKLLVQSYSMRDTEEAQVPTGAKWWSDAAQSIHNAVASHARDNSKTFPDGSSYEGQLKNDVQHGKGRCTYVDGAQYQGDWLNGREHGQGVFTSAKNRYVGDYVRGIKHGYGKFEFADGSAYEGEFLNDNVEGEGNFKFSDGREYQGQWLDNKMHGQGYHVWPDGNSYTGQYVNDLKQGEGSLHWADGRRFTGQWKDGKQHGRGIFVSKQGKERSGEWQDGTRLRWLDPVECVNFDDNAQ